MCVSCDFGAYKLLHRNLHMNQHYAKVYGLIGFPLEHSFSESYFNTKFSTEGIDARYINFEISDIGDLMELVVETPALAGLNVTIPYKEQVIPYMDMLDPVARRVGAVNVIKVSWQRNGSPYFTGFNSDIVGFTESIRPLLRATDGNPLKALVLGTGGASKAVCCALEDLGVTPQLVSRAARDGVITYQDITQEVMREHKIIVNTTPLGMYPHTDACPDIPYDLLDKSYLCYDLLYNPEITLFMRRAAAQGAVVKNGLEMLVLQAMESWRIWNK